MDGYALNTYDLYTRAKFAPKKKLGPKFFLFYINIYVYIYN